MAISADILGIGNIAKGASAYTSKGLIPRKPSKITKKSSESGEQSKAPKAKSTKASTTKPRTTKPKAVRESKPKVARESKPRTSKPRTTERAPRTPKDSYENIKTVEQARQFLGYTEQPPVRLDDIK
jgi:hypothetical protein